MLVFHIIYFVVFLPFLGGNQDLVFVICASEIPRLRRLLLSKRRHHHYSPFPSKRSRDNTDISSFLFPPLRLCAYDVGYIHICRKTLPALVLCRAKKEGDRRENERFLFPFFFLACVGKSTFSRAKIKMDHLAKSAAKLFFPFFFRGKIAARESFSSPAKCGKLLRDKS